MDICRGFRGLPKCAIPWFNFVAMQTVEASLAAIFASTMPLIVACAGWIIFRERLSTLGICGLIAGLIGVALIMGSRIRADVDLFGIALCVVGAASLAAPPFDARFPHLGIFDDCRSSDVGWKPDLWFPAMMLETPTIVWTNSFVYAFIYTTLVPGLLATLVWFILVDRIGAVRASTYHFLNPFLGSRLRQRYYVKDYHPSISWVLLLLQGEFWPFNSRNAPNRSSPDFRQFDRGVKHVIQNDTYHHRLGDGDHTIPTQGSCRPFVMT